MGNKLDDILYEYEMMAHTMSHDLRDPLRQAIIDCDEMHEKDLDEESLSKTSQIMENINEVIMKIAALREYSYLVNQKKFEISTIDCNNIIKEIQDDLKDDIEKHNVLISYKDLPEIKGNKEQIKTLFKNLIDNSIKFKSSETPDIDIKFEDKGDLWEFEFKDNGIGIEKVYREIVFAIFQRLTPEIKDGSMGIGLPFCKRIAKNHGGDVWYKSTNGKGTSFFVTLAKDQARK